MENAPETHFFGVFDGHAGGKCSKAICTTIPYQFCRDEAFPTKVSVALRKAIQRTNEQFLEVAGRMRLNDGSTAVCVVLRGLTMTVSNVGDSRAVLISGKKGIALTEDHKPSTPSEQKRIASFGGTVTYNTGIARVAGVLAVSRAFGNYSIRNLIRADPDIIERELSPQDDFIVLASDGLWDVFTPNEVAEVCHSWNRFGVSRIAEQLVQLSLSRGSMDNVTAVVVSLSKYISRMQQAQRSQSENEGKQRAATASSVLSATATSLSRPDSGYGQSKCVGSLFTGSEAGKSPGGSGQQQQQQSQDDDTMAGDDATITDFDQTILNRNRRSSVGASTGSMSRFGSSHHTGEGEDYATSGNGLLHDVGMVQSARSSSNGGPGDRKLTIVPSSSDSNTSFTSARRPVTQQQQHPHLSSIPLYNHNNSNVNGIKKSGGSNLGITLPTSTTPTNFNGSGSLFSKTSSAHTKTDPPLDRIYSPIVAPSSRKMPASRTRPNTTR